MDTLKQEGKWPSDLWEVCPWVVLFAGVHHGVCLGDPDSEKVGSQAVWSDSELPCGGWHHARE